jgi:hypothetical protein
MIIPINLPPANLENTFRVLFSQQLMRSRIYPNIGFSYSYFEVPRIFYLLTAIKSH